MELANRDRLVRVLITTVVLLLFASMFWPFFMPLLLAALFAFAFENIVTKYAAKYKSRPLVTVALVLMLCLFVVSPIVLVAYKTVSTVKDSAAAGFQNSQIYKMTEEFATKISEKVHSVAKTFDLDTAQLPQLGDIIGRSSQNVAGYAGDILTSLPDRTLSLLVFLASLYYFLVEAKNIKKNFLHLNLLTRNEMNKLIEIVQKSSYITIVASALIGALQASIVATFAYFCGFKEFLILFVLTFIFSLIPVIGAAPVALLLAFLSFLQGNTGSAVILVVAGVVAGTVDNIIKPYIVSSSSDDLHPVLSLLALVGAIIVFGAPGILLGPILTQLALKIIPILFPRAEISEHTNV